MNTLVKSKLDEVTVAFSEELNYMCDLKSSEHVNRIGHLFSTSKNNYYYDTGTGKVICLDDDIFFILQTYFDPQKSVKEFENSIKLLSVEKVSQFLGTSIQEKLFRRPALENFGSDLLMRLPQVRYNIRQLVLEVTDRCNFRCKYCIYNEDTNVNRNFGNKDMDFDTAKKAIDYALLTNQNPVSITFYGGEPLLNFDVIRKSVEYAETKKGDKRIDYSITTNATLIDDEIAKFITSIPTFSVLISLDGPEDRHNKNRVYANNKNSFADVIRGIKCLQNYIDKTDRYFGINAVLTPPFDENTLNRTNDFFEALNFLDNRTIIMGTYPSLGTCPDMEQYFTKIINNPAYRYGSDCDPLGLWAANKAKQNGLDAENCRNLYYKMILDALVSIDGRFISQEPQNVPYCNACCLPGERRLYVSVNGDFKACERIGSSPSIGNIDTGIDIEAIRKHYITDYCNESFEECNACWAFNLCTICYSGTSSETGIEKRKKDINCSSCRTSCEGKLMLYHDMLESNPSQLMILEDTVRET